MADADSSALVAQARADVDAFELESAIEFCQRARELGGRTVEEDVTRCRALVGLERFPEANQIARDLLEHAGDWARPKALLSRARVLRRWSSHIDDALEAALEAAELCEKRGSELTREAADAHLEAARVFAKKRCRKLAGRELDLARDLAGGDDVGVAYNAGVIELDFDDRIAAKERFESIDPETGRGAHYRFASLARLEYVMGEFGAAHAHLDGLDPLPSGALWPMRLRADVFSAEHRWAEAAAALARLVAASPGAVSANRSRYERATCLYHIGDRDAARAALVELVEAAGDDKSYWIHCARRMLGLLGEPDAAERGFVRLAEFPSVSQLRDHCGPASCELYLRYFGLTADQIEIAREIKSEEGGTPVYKMRRFLDEAGFETRRVEAELDDIKRLIDAGIPVIMEESYSTSSHVAVAIGYDDARELLEVQDPMTHRVRETFYEDLTELRNLSNHGALVAAPKSDADLVAALDAAGAAECEYISLVDQAWKAYDDEECDRGDALVDRAIELRRDYELAWLYRFRRARERWSEDETPENKIAIHRILGEVTAIWPDDEWPQQLIGRVLYFIEGRFYEARVAFERARDRDPRDAYNWSMIADCHLRTGDDDAAFDALVEALARDPSYVRPNENLADLARRRDQRIFARQLNDAARELNPENYFNHAVHGQLLEQDGATVAALAAYDAALELDPERDWVVLRKAKLLAASGAASAGLECMAELAGRRPDDVSTLIDYADLLHRSERYDKAIEVCDRIIELDPEHAAGYSLKGAALGQSGALDEGLALLERALEIRPLYGWVHGQRGSLLLDAGRKVEAISAYAAALGLSRGSRAEYDMGQALAAAGYPGEAIRHMRAAATRGRLSEDELREIGELFIESGRAGDVDDFFRDVAGAWPRDLGVLRAHARTMLQVLWAPGSGHRVVRQIEALDGTDPYSVASRGEDLIWENLESEEEGERLLREAIEREPDLVYARRVLADALISLGRHDDALEVLRPCTTDYRDAYLRTKAHIGRDDLDAAQAIADAFRAERGVEGRPCIGALKFEYEIAKARDEWAAALEIAETVSRESHELDDDGKLDKWEEERFECMAHLGEEDRARKFGLSQAMNAESLGRLAYAAQKADRWELAHELAERALRLDGTEALALAAMALSLELRGEIAGAVDAWNRLGEASSDWHIWQEQLARMAAGEGELETAMNAADDGVANGHLCPWSFGVRAHVRFMSGDVDGARADLERAHRLASPSARANTHRDVWALRAALDGKADEAESLFAAYFEEPSVSDLDRRRIEAVRAALAQR